MKKILLICLMLLCIQIPASAKITVQPVGYLPFNIPDEYAVKKVGYSPSRYVVEDEVSKVAYNYPALNNYDINMYLLSYSADVVTDKSLMLAGLYDSRSTNIAIFHFGDTKNNDFLRYVVRHELGHWVSFNLFNGFYNAPEAEEKFADEFAAWR